MSGRQTGLLTLRQGAGNSTGLSAVTHKQLLQHSRDGYDIFGECTKKQERSVDKTMVFPKQTRVKLIPATITEVFDLNASETCAGVTIKCTLSQVNFTMYND